MALPIFQDPNKNLMLMQTKWKSEIDPTLAIPLLGGLQLKSQVLAAGVNVITHKLGRMMQGWIVTDQNAAVVPYRSAPLSATTLTLTASGPVTINLWVY
jgi:hypothetical protein